MEFIDHITLLILKLRVFLFRKDLRGEGQHGYPEWGTPGGHGPGKARLEHDQIYLLSKRQ